MSLLRRGRFLVWLTRDLSRRYTRYLLLGFFAGLASTILLGRLVPFVNTQWFLPVERIGIVGEFTPTTLPPSIQEHISFGLTTLSADGSPSAGLAEYWEATDSGKTYIFRLRDDLTWHNGKKVTALDVNYNIRSVTFEVADDYTLITRLEEPYSPFPTLVVKPILGAGLKGFGPYRVAGIKLKGDTIQYLKLVPRDSKERNTAKEYRFYRTEALAVLAYKLGDIDSIEEISTAYDLRNWGITSVVEHVKRDRVVALYFNLKDQLMAERSLRQALAYAVPKLEEEQAFSPISDTSWAYSDKIKHYTFNPGQAEKLLDTVKVEEGASVTITTFSQYVYIAKNIARSWTQLVIKTTVKVENTVNPEYQVLLSAQDIPPDPDQYPFWHSKPTQTNITSYVNLKIDKLLEDGRRETDQNKRLKIYADFQRFLVEDAPAVFLYYPKVYSLHRSGERIAQSN